MAAAAGEELVSLMMESSIRGKVENKYFSILPFMADNAENIAKENEMPSRNEFLKRFLGFCSRMSAERQFVVIISLMDYYDLNKDEPQIINRSVIDILSSLDLKKFPYYK
jgi:hypothetical protein